MGSASATLPVRSRSSDSYSIARRAPQALNGVCERRAAVRTTKDREVAMPLESVVGANVPEAQVRD